MLLFLFTKAKAVVLAASQVYVLLTRQLKFTNVTAIPSESAINTVQSHFS